MTFLAVELGHQATMEEIFASAQPTGDARLRRLVLRLEQGESAPSIVSNRRLWGPMVLTTFLWEDGGHEQVVRDRTTLPLAELNAMVATENLVRPAPTRSERYFAHGREHTLWQWARQKECEVPYHTLRKRVVDLKIPLLRALRKEPLLTRSERDDGPRYFAYGKTLTVRQWADEPECEVTYRTLKRRVDDGMKIWRALKKKTGLKRKRRGSDA